MADSSDEVITDPNDPRLNINTPGQPGYAPPDAAPEAPTATSDFDPKAFIKGADDIPEIPSGSLRPTTYGPGSPNPTPADMREFTGNADNALKGGDTALQPYTADKYGLKTGDKFKYEGNVYTYADTPAAKVGPVIDVYHPPDSGFDPSAFIKGKTEVQPPMAATTAPDRMPNVQFDPKAFMSGETPAPDTSGVEDLSTTDKLVKGLGQGLQDAGKIIGKLAKAPDEYKITQQPTPFQIQGERSIPAALIPTVQSSIPQVPLPQAAPAPLPAPPPAGPSILEKARTAFAKFEADNPYPQPIHPPAMANTLASLAFPQAAYTGQVIEGAGGAISNFIQGHPISDITGMTPRTKALVGDANDTEPFSQERFDASMSMLAESSMMGAVSGPSQGMSREIPGALAGKPPPGGRQVAVPQAIVPSSGKLPLLSGATRNGPTIRMSFDATGGVPTPEELQKQFSDMGHNVSVSKFKTDLVSATRGQVNYRVDVFDKSSRMSSDLASKLMSDAFGSDEPFRGQTKFEQAIPLQQRFAAAHDYGLRKMVGASAARESEVQGAAKPAAAPPAKPPPPPKPPPPSEPLPQSEELNPVPGSGKFKRSYRVDKEMGDRMEGIGASRESGALQAELQSRNLLHELTKQQEHDFGKLLVSDRLQSVNPNHPQILDPKTERAIASDPAIAKAFDYYVKEIKPEIEALRKRAGLSEKAAAGKGPGFISLIPTTNEVLPPKPGGHIPQTSRLSRTTRFAKAAEGQAKEYSTNLREILRESYSEATRKARVADFYKATQAKGITENGTYEELPSELQHDLTAATQPELNQMPIQRNPNFGLRTTLWDTTSRAGRGARSAFTGAALTANPAEIFNHMRRQLNILASKPPVGEGVTARMEVLAPYFGPKIGAFKRAVMEDMSLPENQRILQDIFDAGGGSTRSFGERYTSGIPGLKQLQGKTTKLLFGVPKGKGMSGWDLRMRVQLEKIRRSAEGNNDPQRIREFANQIGQYGSHTSWFVRGLKTFNPFAATTGPMRVTEARTLVGGSGLKSQGIGMASLRRGETFMRGTGGTLLALASANYALSGKWPWENDAGHEFDINTGVKDKDNNTVYVKLKAVAPEMARPISMLSIPDLLRERSAKQPDYLSAGAMGPLNTATSLVSGPAQNFALTATTGRVPYFLRRPGEGAQLMDISRLTKDEKQAGASRGVKQLKEAAKGINPIGNIFGDQFQVEAPGALHYMEEPIPGVKPFGNIYSTSYQPKEKSAPSRRPSSRGNTGRRATSRRSTSSR